MKTVNFKPTVDGPTKPYGSGHTVAPMMPIGQKGVACEPYEWPAKGMGGTSKPGGKK